MKVNNNLAVCFEQMAPSIRKKFSYPGESFSQIIENLESNPDPNVEALLKVIEKLNNVRNENLIKIVGIFELDMHSSGEN